VADDPNLGRDAQRFDLRLGQGALDACRFSWLEGSLERFQSLPDFQTI
jgi:hypothetical protein